MSDIKFAVEEEKAPAVRTAADRISTQRRRSRREINGTIKHLGLDPAIVAELSQQGHLAWLNADDPHKPLSMYEDLGYRYVTNSEAYGERDGLNPDARAVVRYGTCDKDNNPQDIYLMLQPWQFHDEDQAVLNEANGKLDKLVKNAGKDQSGGYGLEVKYGHG